MSAQTNWRAYLRRLVGDRNQEMFQVLVDLARGVPRVPRTSDGLLMAPIVPTAEIQFQAAKFLTEMGLGKPVNQLEQVSAEQEASELEAVAALSDEELKRRVFELYGGKEAPEDAVLLPPAPEPARLAPGAMTFHEVCRIIYSCPINPEPDDE